MLVQPLGTRSFQWPDLRAPEPGMHQQSGVEQVGDAAVFQFELQRVYR